MANPTKRVGLIGFPVRHSVSPVFQQAALDFHYISARYEAWETAVEQLPERVGGLRQPECLGANVTVPHKEAALLLVDDLDAQAERIGAINTIVNRDGRLVGFNTDVVGFLTSLEKEAGFRATGKRAVLLGAGGAARAVAFAFGEAGADQLVIVNRTVARAARLASEVRDLYGMSVVSIDLAGEQLASAVGDADVLINATPVGMRHSPREVELPVPEAVLHPELLVYDLVYNPARTLLIAAAERIGARVMPGLPMLIYQGAAAFELWTGKPAPIGLMFERAREALSRENV